MIKRNTKIFVAGHKGMVGRAIVSKLEKEGYKNLVLKSRDELNLLDYHSCKDVISQENVEYIIIAAAKVGGIKANSTFPYSFISENLIIQSNIIQASVELGVKNLIFLGSSCIYPKFSKQPICESELLNGPLEKTNQWYAIAKIAGIKMAQAAYLQYGYKYSCIMPTNLYGEHDNFNPNTSHVIPGIIAKIYKAKKENLKKVELWGTGNPLREFMYVEDLANAIFMVMQSGKYFELINVGSNQEYSIKEIAKKIKNLMEFEGEICWNINEPDGTPRKLLNSSKFLSNFNFNTTSLEKGLIRTINFYKTLNLEN